MDPVTWPTGIKRTRQRVLVLEILRTASTPLSTVDILTLLERAGTPIWLSTLYRILDTFTEHGMVLKTLVLESGVSIYELSKGAHRHYAVCVQCHRVIAIENCPMESFLPRICEENFHVLGHQLQMYGYCASCIRQAEKKSATNE